MKGLAERLTLFIKDLDFFDYSDSLEIDETDEDAIEKSRAMLEDPALVLSAIQKLEDVIKTGVIEENEIEEQNRCQDLINELQSLYREQQQRKNTYHAERSTR